jgi:mRNA interferase MazF
MDRVTALRGELWYSDWGHPVGHEQGGTRPALIVSHDRWNRGPARLVIALPLTSKDKRLPHHVRIDPPEAGLTKTGFVKCEDIRSISTLRLLRKLGVVSPATLAAVQERLRQLLALWVTQPGAGGKAGASQSLS